MGQGPEPILCRTLHTASLMELESPVEIEVPPIRSPGRVQNGLVSHLLSSHPV